ERPSAWRPGGFEYQQCLRVRQGRNGGRARAGEARQVPDESRGHGGRRRVLGWRGRCDLSRGWWWRGGSGGGGDHRSRSGRNDLRRGDSTGDDGQRPTSEGARPSTICGVGEESTDPPGAATGGSVREVPDQGRRTV